MADAVEPQVDSAVHVTVEVPPVTDSPSPPALVAADGSAAALAAGEALSEARQAGEEAEEALGIAEAVEEALAVTTEAVEAIVVDQDARILELEALVAELKTQLAPGPEAGTPGNPILLGGEDGTVHTGTSEGDAGEKPGDAPSEESREGSESERADSAGESTPSAESRRHGLRRGK